MKKLYKVLAIILVICLLIFVCIQVNNRIAYADALTASIIAGSSYALMNSWGISFNAISASGGGMENFLVGEINDYATQQGSSLIELFGSEVARAVTGKLVVGYQLYNGIKNFVNWLSDKFDLGVDETTLSDGFPFGVDTLTQVDESVSSTGISVIQNGNSVFMYYNGNYVAVSTYKYNGPSYMALESPSLLGYTLSVNEGGKTIFETTWLVRYIPREGGDYQYWTNVNTTTTNLTAIIEDGLSWNGLNYVQPTVLNPSQEWVGDFGYPSDTNLDQLIGQVFDDVADNNIDVDGEVIDVPTPPPTPVPIDPDTPLSDVPWEGMDNNLQNLYNQGLEEIGAIGDAQDAITDAVAEQTGALEGAIAGNAGVVSGAIGQAVSDVQEAIQDQTTALDQSLSATAEGVETIAEALEDETIDWQKFDLRGLFPFCIPFDIYNMLEALDASPTAPHVQLPFVIESIGFSYTIDLDFSSFDQVASVMRTMELIVYGIALAWATSKVIKW